MAHGAKSAIPPDHQIQSFKGCPMCGLHVPVSCGRAAATAKNRGAGGVLTELAMAWLWCRNGSSFNPKL